MSKVSQAECTLIGPKETPVPKKSRKLNITMIPEPLWNFNLREFLKYSQWRKLRKQHIEKHGAVCVTCGKDVSAPRAAHCHELWEYKTNQSPAIARLKGLSMACWHCHMAEHWGVLQKLSVQMPRAIPDTIEHYCKVNGVTPATLQRDVKRASGEWRRLSTLEWELDWGDYAPLLLESHDTLPQLR